MLTIKPLEFTLEGHAIRTYLHNVHYRFWQRDLKRMIEDIALRRSDKEYQDFLAWDGDLPVAYICVQEAFWLHDPQLSYLELYHPASLEADKVNFLVEFAEKLATEAGRPKITTEVIDLLGDPEFWAARGYVNKMSGPVSRCILKDVNFDQFSSSEDTFRSHGYEIVSLGELEAREDCREKFWKLREEIFDDVPHSGKREPQTFERFCELYPKEMAFPRATTFFAVKDGELVGLSGGERQVIDPSMFDTHLTGTLRSHRRKGVATTLKLHVIRWCLDNGVLTIDTGNEKDNPMYQLNIALGFRKFCAFEVWEMPDAEPTSKAV